MDSTKIQLYDEGYLVEKDISFDSSAAIYQLTQNMLMNQSNTKKLEDDINKAKKYDSNKVQMDLLPSKSLKAIAKIFTFGAKKYGEYNWAKGFEYSRLYAAIQRHLNSWNEGEDNDPETGENHLLHAACGLMMLIEHILRDLGKDDRYFKNNK